MTVRPLGDYAIRDVGKILRSLESYGDPAAQETVPAYQVGPGFE